MDVHVGCVGDDTLPQMDRTATSWIGIGAQRSGTTWFTDLLLRHPRMALAGGGKELHHFDRSIVTGASEVDEYRRLFESTDGIRIGEFTPSYLRCLWIPRPLRQAAPSATVYLVLLRHPVARFESAMRWYLAQDNVPDEKHPHALARFSRLHGVDATWAGMYATQLAVWADVVGRDNLMVFQYEAIADRPDAAVEQVWARLGLEPVDMGDPYQPSRTTSDRTGPWQLPEDMRSNLTTLYHHDMVQLASSWGFDLDLWGNEAARSHE
jgi:hypothetical protein